MKYTWSFYLANESHTPNADLEVTDKYTGEVAARVAMANPRDINAGIAACVEATAPFASMPPYERQGVLNHCVARFTERFEELACHFVSKQESRSEIRGARSVG